MKKESVYRKVCLALAAVLLIPLWVATASCAEQKPAPKGPSLYERIGGINMVAALVDDVVERSYVDEVFNANPRIVEAHKRFPKTTYKFNATALACMVMGGPQKYTGRSLKDAHQHLWVTEKEWTAFTAILHDSLDSFKIPQQEQDEFFAIIESTKGDVVVPSAKAAENR